MRSRIPYWAWRTAAPSISDRGGPGGWWILDEPEIHLMGDILVPDIAGWRRERMPRLPETAWFDLAPDWLCEILSPSTARVDRAEKLPIYARWGVPHVWLVDPDLRTLEAYENQSGRWVLLATLKDDEAVSLPPFDAISFSLGGSGRIEPGPHPISHEESRLPPLPARQRT
jgi:Uma2 family endonuclease